MFFNNYDTAITLLALREDFRTVFTLHFVFKDNPLSSHNTVFITKSNVSGIFSVFLSSRYRVALFPRASPPPVRWERAHLASQRLDVYAIASTSSSGGRDDGAAPL